MIWRDPLYLWLLPLVAALGAALAVLVRRRATALQTFVEAGLAARLAPAADRRRVWRRGALRVAVLFLLAAALAGPKWGFQWQEVKREGIDLIIAIDTSRSMLATDVKPDRLARAKLAVLDLVPLLQGDRIGLVAFAGTAFLECPLTLDYAAFERSLRAIEVGIIPRGGTALARAIETSLDAFEARQGKYEALILITDGEDHEGDVQAAAARAAERGVKIFTVGIGTSDGELLPLGADGYVKDRRGQVVKSRLNAEPLKDVAVATGGAYVQGLGPSLGLDQVFREHIAPMERREVASTLERRYEERFQIPLALALLLLLVEITMPARRPAARRAGWRRWARSRGAALLVLGLSPWLVGWFDPPGDRAAEGNQLYAEGKFEAAAGKYGEGLVDAPLSPLLQFNLATALYKQGKYGEAISAFEKAAASGAAEWVARANYNIGNAQYRVGADAEASDPQAAIASWEQALASYKRSMVADPADPDPKFNHELVAHQLAELRKRLEEEQQQEEQEQPPPEEQEQGDDQQEQQEQEPREQQEQEQQDQAEQPEQQPGDEEQAEQPQPEPGAEEEPPAEQAAGEEPPPEEQAAEPGSGAGEPIAGEEESETPEEQTAHAVLDTARGEELSPQDIDRPVGAAAVADPARDW